MLASAAKQESADMFVQATGARSNSNSTIAAYEPT